ncbi:hypothetical protein [Paenibacillus endoradicis]|uniref:hypothetical protein n=1 Tax=Paenibacillus endoradicis TaxID=2972487 RepID=UPI0021598DDE|nr:hypothetical protein [Paenibacillus endoradicis]MCR8656473.1 hypothetical protein [Paenibacillus endoradicis]
MRIFGIACDQRFYYEDIHGRLGMKVTAQKLGYEIAQIGGTNGKFTLNGVSNYV